MDDLRYVEYQYREPEWSYEMDEQPTTNGSLSLAFAAKIAKAALEVGGKLTPDKKNREQNYDYISADKVIAIGGEALAKQGVVIIPAVISQAVTAVERPNKSPRLDASIQFDMLVTDGDTHYHAPWLGFGSDYMTPDKAIYKAITSGHKYFLSKLLMIGAGNEDGEHEEEKPQPRTVSRETIKQGKHTPDQGWDFEAPPMSYAMAAQEIDSKGKLYIEYTSDELAERSRWIAQAITTAKNGKKQEELKLKQDAIRAILAERSKP